MINHNSRLILLAASFAATACVTINIYFPAAAAEKVADKIIDEVWQTGDEADDKDQSGEKSDHDTRNDNDKIDNKSDKTRP